jgi:hypothetical protein
MALLRPEGCAPLFDGRAVLQWVSASCTRHTTITVLVVVPIHIHLLLFVVLIIINIVGRIYTDTRQVLGVL